MQATPFVSIFTNYLMQLPYYAVWAAGIVLAVVRWQRHPRVSLLAVIGIGILFVNSLVGTTLTSALPIALVSRGMHPTYARLAGVLAIVRAVLSIVSAVGFGVLLAAVFGERVARPALEEEG